MTTGSITNTDPHWWYQQINNQGTAINKGPWYDQSGQSIGSSYKIAELEKSVHDLGKALEEVIENNLAMSLTSNNPVIRQIAERIAKQQKYKAAVEEARQKLSPEILEVLGLK